jgi:hypothetical protein
LTWVISIFKQFHVNLRLLQIYSTLMIYKMPSMTNLLNFHPERLRMSLAHGYYKIASIDQFLPIFVQDNTVQQFYSSGQMAQNNFDDFAGFSNN